MTIKSCIECKYFKENEFFMKRKGFFKHRLESTTYSIRHGLCELSLDYTSINRRDYYTIETCGS